MSKTRKPEPLKTHAMVARTLEHCLGQGVEGACPRCHGWQVLAIRVDVDEKKPLRDGEYRVLPDDTLYPVFVCDTCVWEGRVKLVKDRR